MQQEVPSAEVASRLEALLLSNDKDSVLLGLELLRTTGVELHGLTPIVALSLFHRSPEVRDLAERSLSGMAGASLRQHISAHWEPTHLKGRAEVFYKSVKAIGQHRQVQARKLMSMAVRLANKPPEMVAEHFPQAFLEWARLQRFQGDALHLDGYQFPYLPHSIGALEDLEYLSVKDCGLKRLPKAITKLQNLIRLDLSHNQLTELPDFLAELTRLYDLRWRDNPIADFPKVLARIGNLQKLDLDMRHLKRLRGLEKCQQVRWLNLKDAQLKELPEEVMALTQLVSLEVAEAGLKTLPRSIGAFQEMEELNLGANAIADLPGELLELRKLKSLALGKVRKVGELDSFASMQALWRLTMEPALSHWPRNWCDMPGLMELHLSEGELETLPPEFSQLQNLIHLDLSQNHFDLFPEVVTTLPDLMELNFHSNRLSRLPGSIGQMKSLSVLDLSHNPLHTLPEEIFELRRLVRLDLQNTHLPRELQERLKAELPHTKVRFG